MAKPPSPTPLPAAPALVRRGAAALVTAALVGCGGAPAQPPQPPQVPPGPEEAIPPQAPPVPDETAAPQVAPQPPPADPGAAPQQ